MRGASFTGEHVERLQAVTEAGLAHLALDDLLDTLVTRARDLLGADTAAILLLDDRGENLVARAAKGLEEEVERGVTIPIGRGFAGRVVADRRSITIDDVDHADILNPLLREKGVRSLLGVPLIVEGRALGVLHVGTLTPRRFDQADSELLQAAGDRAALAIEHARLFEQERRAREAAEARAPAALALEHVADGVFLLDDEERIRFWNPAAATATGVDEEHALGRTVGEVITAWESVRSIVPVALAPAVTRAETVPMEVAGRELWLSMSGVGFHGGTVYAFRNVTDERRLEDWQSEFIATISHEIRTPMASVYGAAQTLRRKDVELDDETRSALLGVIFNESARLAKLVENILVASRLGAEALEVGEAAVDPRAVAEDVIDSLRVHTNTDVRFSIVAPPSVPRVTGDAERLRHVLRNLLENAAKYSPGGGTVTVRLEPQERHVRFAVQDEGLGIPPHERAHVFERFYRIDEHAKRGIGGTGLGLYISRELVRRMRGRIWVSSEQVQGSTFFVELPLADGDRVAAS